LFDCDSEADSDSDPDGGSGRHLLKQSSLAELLHSPLCEEAAARGVRMKTVKRLAATRKYFGNSTRQDWNLPALRQIGVQFGIRQTAKGGTEDTRRRHRHEYRLRPGGLYFSNDGLEICHCLRPWHLAKHVIAAQFNDDGRRVMSVEQGGQTGESLGRRIAADAAVDYTPARKLRKLCRPGLRWLEPVAGGDAVPQHKDNRACRQAIELMPGTGCEADQYQHRQEQDMRASQSGYWQGTGKRSRS
jgi:hypothetical protein